MGKKEVKGKRNLIYGMIFLIGFMIMAYPFVSRFYYRIESNEQVLDFQNTKSKIDKAELEQRMEKARAYNALLNNNVSDDPYSEEMLKQGKKEYARMLEVHEKIGHVQIPRIDIDIPIYAGTSEEVLQIGAGHLEGTSLPIGGNNSHTVITAHSGLPTARLFSDLSKVQIGDKFYIHNIEGVLAYQVDDITTIDPDDFSRLLIVPGHDYATLLTCTPIMINTHRLLVRGHRVDYVEAVEEASIREYKTAHIYRYLFYASIPVILFLIFLNLRLRSRKKRLEKRYRELKVNNNEKRT